MKTHYALLSTILIVAILTSCASNHYVSESFDQETVDHVSVAVLPFEVVFIGNVPARMTDQDLLDAQIEEGLTYQASLHHEILQSSVSRRKPVSVDLQDYRSTRARLKKHDISVEQSWEMAPDELAQLLGVDAVVAGSVRTRHLLTNGQSFGIDLARRVINALPSDNVPFIGSDAANTAEIVVRYGIVDGEDGSILWSFSCPAEADWQQKPEEAIANLNRRAARKFPYRYSMR